MALIPADPRDLAFMIQYALGYGLDCKPLGGPPMGPNAMAQHILAHLARSGYVVMQGPPAVSDSSADFGLQSVP